ncbi:hypothetical protein, partial [Tractidigestivibacter montrealensis]
RSVENLLSVPSTPTLANTLYRRDWSRASPGEFRSALEDYVEWYRDGRLKLFVEPDGTRHYEAIMGRRRRLGLAV